MSHRWESRYSSCEMIYVEIVGDRVHVWLNHSPQQADRYTFDQVLAGALDNEVGAVFGQETLEEIKKMVRERRSDPK